MYYSKLYEFGYYHGLVPDIDNEQLAEIIMNHGHRESEDVADTTHEDFDFPDNELDKEEYPIITPVNSFRILFNKYFGTDYELLENRAFLEIQRERSYAGVMISKDWKFNDVTDSVIENRP